LPGSISKSPAGVGLEPNLAEYGRARLAFHEDATFGARADAHDAEFDDLILHVDGWLCEVKDAQIRDGLHVLGSAPQGADRVNLVLETRGQAELPPFVADLPAGPPARRGLAGWLRSAWSSHSS